MKSVLQFIWNILLFIMYIFMMIFPMILWFGKLPKVSPYHYFTFKGRNYFDVPEIFNDITIQSKIFPDKKQEDYINKAAITEFLLENQALLRTQTKRINKHTNKIEDCDVLGALVEKLNEKYK